MELDLVRDHAMYAVIFGFFGFSWFGWAQADPPETWRLPLGIASAFCLSVALLGGYFALKHWGDTSALTAAGAYEKFGIIVGLEVIISLVGALLLQKTNHTNLIAAWVAFVVGVHFIPLASLFKDTALYYLAGLMTCAPVLAIFASRTTSITSTTATCITAGCSVLLFAIRGIILVVR